MINFAKDPKGFYVALGVDENASADDIKSAFRTKAKKLHPDRNPSPIAAKQFHRIHEAYETLSDPLKRATYDRGWRTVGGGMGGGPKPKPEAAEAAKPQSKPEPPKSEQPKPEHPKAEPRKPEPPPRPEREAQPAAATVEPPATCKCGAVTAQPRYIAFDMVWGRGRRVFKKSLTGIYCRTCADKAAIRASMVSWFAGWWAVPGGPSETIKAIVSNMRGGRRPAERNARLLIKQSRAFRARGEMELARGCAEQALSFAANPGLRREIDSLLLSLSSFPARALKDRWARPGVAPMVQALPLAIIVGGMAMALTLKAPMSLTDAVQIAVESVTAPAGAPAPDVAAEASGRIYAVVTETTLRTGPGENYQVVATLSANTVVMVIEPDPSGHWGRAVTEANQVGFVAMGNLTAEVPVDALSAFGKRGR